MPGGTKLSAGLDRIKLHDMDCKINRRIFIPSFDSRSFLLFSVIHGHIRLSPLFSLFPFPPFTLSRENIRLYIFFHTFANVCTSCRSHFLKIRTDSGYFTLATHVVARTTDIQEIMAVRILTNFKQLAELTGKDIKV